MEEVLQQSPQVPTSPSDNSKPKQYLLIISIIVVILIAISGVLGYQIGLRIGIKTATPPPVTPTPTSVAGLFNTCPQYGYPSKNTFLKSYTIQPGDSLLSIVKNQVGDPSRVQEVIAMNQDTYPQLSVQTPFLEVGSKLLIPPPTFPASSGDLFEVQGIITQIDTDHWIIQGHSPKTSGGTDIWLQPNTQYTGKKNFSVGNCVAVIVDSLGNSSQHALIISPQ